MSSADMTGAEIIVQSLLKEGTDVLFGIPGGMNLPFVDQLYKSPLRHILTRHEQGASHMADGYARATGKVGVCYATSGPGVTNIVTGLATAYMDSVPMVAITGQVATGKIGNDAFQECDATGVTRSITKHNYLVKDIRDLAHTIREAFHIARSGRPGPVHVDIPIDIQRAKTEFAWPEKVRLRGNRVPARAPSSQIRKAADLINATPRAVLYVGGGAVASGAAAEIFALAEKADIPVTTTLMAMGMFPVGHPLFMGMLGMHGTYAANMAVQHADLLISVGARFDDRVTGRVQDFSTGSRKIHFDVDPSQISKSVHADAPVVGDVRVNLQQLLPLIQKKNRKAWRAEVGAWDTRHPMSYRTQGPSGRARPQCVSAARPGLTTGEAIGAAGVGQHQMWVPQYYKFQHPRQYINSGGLGTMGYGFPAAIGAKIGCPDRTVICVDGDGCFQMTMCELATAMLNKVAVKTVIINNLSLGMVRQWQEMFYQKRYTGIFLNEPSGALPENLEKIPYPPDFVKFAEAYGALGLRIERKAEVAPALERMLKADGPVIVDCRVEPYENVYPMVPAGASLDEIIPEDPGLRVEARRSAA